MTSDRSTIEAPNGVRVKHRRERDDDGFLAAFFDCTLPPEEFHHRDHVRLTWLALRRWGLAEGTARVLAGILRYATAQGAARKFDDALTRRWIARVSDALGDAPPDEPFDDFLARQPRLLDKDIDAAGPAAG